MTISIQLACDDLFETISSTFIGPHFLTCVIVGCGTQFLLSHQDFVRRLVMRDEDLGMILDSSFLDWFSINVSL